MKRLTADKIKSWQALRELRQTWKNDGKTVVFTNGCFDLMHLGHADYLERAAQLGDRLVVAINTDASVRRYKGEERPIQDERARARIMAAMAFVDAVTLFDEDTPLALIAEIVPDILVKGSDYLAENIVGADIVKNAGGEVRALDFIAGYSTSKIIERIKTTNKQ